MERLTLIRLAAAGSLAMALPSHSGADVVNIVSDRDNTLIEDELGAFSNGAGQQFFTGRIVQGTLRRGIIHFSLGTIPPGSTVTAVSLRLSMTQTTSGASNVSLRRCLADWGEGTSSGSGGGGDLSTPGDATWIHRFFPTSFWTNPGGDFSSFVSATTSVGGVGDYTWTGAGMVSDVQVWLIAPADNLGWVIIGDESGPVSAKKYESRESASVAQRPVLTVTFAPPASCRVDWDHNGQIQPSDVASFVTDWFASLSQGTLAGDFDGNGVVAPADVASFVAAWFAALSSGHC